MFRKHCITLIALFLLASPLCQAQETQQILVQSVFYRITADVSGDMSLTENIWAGKEKPTTEQKRLLSLFTIADLKIGDDKLKVDKKGWAWNKVPFNKKTSFSQTFRRVSTPQILVRDGESASLNIGSQQPVEYFEKHLVSNYYELKKEAINTGLELTVKAHTEKEKIRLEGLTITVQSIGKRAPLEGVTLPVGKPILQKQEVKADLLLTPGREYGLLFNPSDGNGLLLIKLKVAYAENKKTEDKEEKEKTEQTSADDVKLTAPEVAPSTTQ